MELKYILLSILCLVHIIYTYRIQLKVNSSTLLNKKQKVFNSVLIWLIPFFWYYVVKESITIDQSVMTKSKRDQLNKKENAGFYESGKGMLGDG